MAQFSERFSGRNRVQEVVPNILMGMYFREGVENPGFFMMNICPHLVAAFVEWQIHTSEQDLGKESRAALESSYKSISPALVSHSIIAFELSFTRAHIREALGLEPGIDLSQVQYTVEGFELLYARLLEMEPHLFDVKVIQEPNVELSPDEIVDVNMAFETIMLYKPWERFFRATGIPFAMEFDRAISAFPEAINLGEITLRRVFDKFLLPTFVNEPKYRNMFYKYFAKLYEQSSDMNIKKGVFTDLFALLPGENINVLDAGCGTGLAHTYKPIEREIELLGIDASPEMVAIAQSRGEMAAVGLIEETEPPADGFLFDHAMMSFVDYWLPDSDRNTVFGKLKKIVKPRGKVVFNVHKPYDGWEEDYVRILKDECGYNSISFSSRLIERTGGGVYTAYYVVAEV